MTLDNTQYGFQSGVDGSSLSITIDGNSAGECDAFFALSIGDQHYITFAVDFDGALILFSYLGNGIFIYPSCTASNTIAVGDASRLFPMSEPVDGNKLRAVLFTGNYMVQSLSLKNNGRTWPITFELTNNNISNTFIFNFTSQTFPNGLSCEYATSVPTNKDFKLYITPDGYSETIKIKSFTITTTTPSATPMAPTSMQTELIVKSEEICPDGYEELSGNANLCKPCGENEAGRFGICEQCGNGKEPNDDRTGCVSCQGQYAGQDGYCDVDCSLKGMIADHFHDHCMEKEEAWYATDEFHAVMAIVGVVTGCCSCAGAMRFILGRRY